MAIVDLRFFSSLSQWLVVADEIISFQRMESYVCEFE